MTYFTPKILRELEKRKLEMSAHEEEHIAITSLEDLKGKLFEGHKRAEHQTGATKRKDSGSRVLVG